jgi:MFS family permease
VIFSLGTLSFLLTQDAYSLSVNLGHLLILISSHAKICSKLMPFLQSHTLSALKVRNFRLFWTGLINQVLGQHMYQFSLGWLAFDLTGSQSDLSLIQLFAFLPQFSITLLGGALADRFDPRRLIQLAQSLSVISVVSVGFTTWFGLLEFWHLACASFVFGLVNGIDEPSRVSFFPRLLPKEQLASGIPLVSMAFGTSRIVAPSIAGFIIAAIGAPAVFLFSALGLSTMITMLFWVKAKTVNTQPSGSLVRNIIESFQHIQDHEVFSKVIIAALLNATLAMGYIHILPVLAKVVLKADAMGLGLLASGVGIGALCGLFSYPWFQSRVTPRNLMVYALSAYCFAFIGVALSQWFWVSFVLLILVGLGQANFLTSCQVALQTHVEDHYRGRVMAMFSLVWSLVYLSGFLLNFTGSLIGPQRALLVNALIVLTYIWLSMARSNALKTMTWIQKQSA